MIPEDFNKSVEFVYWYTTTSNSNRIQSQEIPNTILSIFKFTEMQSSITSESFRLNNDITYSFKLERRTEDFDDPLYHDKLLVAYDEDSNRYILVESIKDSIPRLRERRDFTLVKLSFPENSTKLFFRMGGADDAGAYSLYFFDLESLQFSKMNVYQYYTSTGNSELSQNGLMIASVIDYSDLQATGKQDIYILDLIKDSSEVISITLKGDETLVDYTNLFYGGPIYDFEWKDNSAIEYGIYNVTEPITPDTSRTLIEKRTISIY